MNEKPDNLSPATATAQAEVGAEVEAIGPPPRAGSKLWLIRLTSMVVVVGGWEYFGRKVNPLFMSFPSAILKAAGGLIASGELLTSLESSFKTLLIGFVLASCIGAVIGLLIGRYRAVDAATDWLVNALYATPLVAIIPLVTLWFGLGDAAKLFIVSILTVFPVLINTAAGVRNVPKQLIDVGAAFAANELEPSA